MYRVIGVSWEKETAALNNYERDVRGREQNAKDRAADIDWKCD